jgi:hypothetical protein
VYKADVRDRQLWCTPCLTELISAIKSETLSPLTEQYPEFSYGSEGNSARFLNVRNLKNETANEGILKTIITYRIFRIDGGITGNANHMTAAVGQVGYRVRPLPLNEALTLPVYSDRTLQQGNRGDVDGERNTFTLRLLQADGPNVTAAS